MQTKIPELDKAGLRQFGLTTGVLIALIFGLFLPWVFNLNWPMWPWIIAGVLAIWALALPDTLGPLYRGWMRVGLLISKVTTPLIMGLVFLVAFFPTALIMKIIRRDALHRSFDPDARTYRQQSENLPTERIEKPY